MYQQRRADSYDMYQQHRADTRGIDSLDRASARDPNADTGALSGRREQPLSGAASICGSEHERE